MELLTLCDLDDILMITQVVIFCNTKRKVDWLTEKMREVNFTIQHLFIYAPSIQFQQTLVAGVAMEFNCVNEMDIELTLNEILLMLKLTDQVKTLIESNVSPQKENTQIPKKIVHIEQKTSVDKKSIDDSGVGS